ncbi:MAG TPA: hypothetical protein VH079_02185 [Terriglobales bacterium]|jgi:phage terminase large subunit-like protein|nr:hypothetical protein [Terriglobales bacterium]
MTLIQLYQLLGMIADRHHRKALEEYFEPFARREGNSIVVMPPGQGKTQMGIVTCVFIFLLDPAAHVIVRSATDRQAHVIVRNVLRLLQSDVVQKLYPFRFSKMTESEFVIDAPGCDGRTSMLGAGVNSVILGARATHLIWDDGVKDMETALGETMEKIWDNYVQVDETRLVDKAAVLFVNTRWALSDCAGRILQRAQDNRLSRQFKFANFALTNRTGRDSYEFDTATGSQREYLARYDVLPTLEGFPFSMTPSGADTKQADIGPVAFETVYQGNCSSTHAQLFSPKYARRVSNIDSSGILAGYQSYDTSMGSNVSSDPTAGVDALLMRDGAVILVDAFEDVLHYGLQKDVIAERCFSFEKKWNVQPLVLIEAASTGVPLAADLRAMYRDRISIELHPVTKSKHLRGLAIQGAWMAGQVYLWEQMSLLGKLLTDMSNYPLDAKNDHIPDAVCQLVSHIRGHHVALDNKPHLLIDNTLNIESLADEFCIDQAHERRLQGHDDDEGEGYQSALMDGWPRGL